MRNHAFNNNSNNIFFFFPMLMNIVQMNANTFENETFIFLRVCVRSFFLKLKYFFPSLYI